MDFFDCRRKRASCSFDVCVRNFNSRGDMGVKVEILVDKTGNKMTVFRKNEFDDIVGS